MADPLSPGADLAKVYGEDRRCPSCGAFAKTVPHAELRWVCAVCGAPRIEAPKLSEETTLALREAGTAQRDAAMQRVVTWLGAVPAVVSLALGLVLAPTSLLATGALVGMGLVLAIVASRASRRAATERKRLRSAVERAWEAAVLGLADEDRSIPEIGTALRIAEADVEAALAAHGQVRVADVKPRVTAEPLALEDEPTSDEKANKA